MVGRVEFRKNIVVAAQAMKLLADRGVDLELHVAGSLGSPEAPGIRRQCEAAWSARSIRWHGEVDELTLHRLHEEATMLLFPSLYEGFGIPPLEALVAGIPVVASDIEVHRETMGGITRLVSPTSVEAWADAIGAVLDGSADMPHDVAARLRERSIAWDLCASATAASYQRVLS
jgi:glycosyltransferase involved in cell wall biosynthesis